MKKWLKSFAKFFNSKQQLVIGLVIGLLIAGSYGLGVSRNRNNQNEKVNTAQEIIKSVQEQDEINSKDTSNSSETPVSNNQTSQTRTTTQTSTQPSPQTSNTTAPISTTPTVLSDCFYQNGEKAGQNCPYSPPPSWSTNSIYNCYTQNGQYAACSAYLDTVYITSVEYVEHGNTPTNFCVFTFKNNTYKPVRVSISTGETRCHSDQAMEYDPWVGY